MKRFLRSVTVTVMVAAAIAVAPSMTQSAFAADDRAGAWSETNYGGVGYSIPYYYCFTCGRDYVAPVAINSVINHTNVDLYGFSRDDSVSYKFWHAPDASWSYIGSPFSTSGNKSLTTFSFNQ